MTPRAAATEAADSALDAVRRIPLPDSHMSDDELLALTRAVAGIQNAAQRTAAALAAEISARSRVDAGHEGLAQRTGHRTAEELVRVTTGSTKREAAVAVRIGRLAAVAADPIEPAWRRRLGEAVAAGSLAVGGAEAIRAAFADTSEQVDPALLEQAVIELLDRAPELDTDRVARLARELRDTLDLAGVADREAARHEARSLRLIRQADGGTRLIWDLDVETAALCTALYDRATSPRRGGPRFVDAGAAARAEAITADGRTTEQLASDAFAQLLRNGAATPNIDLVGTDGATVNVLVTRDALESRIGMAHIEGQSQPVSIATAERLACGGTTVELTFDGDGRPLDVGREQRLYTRRQRRALAARDGGCRWPGCDRPPSWTEAHHIEHWARDGGRTDIDDGILLCRHHHLLLHNAGWEITRAGPHYSLVPPAPIDPDRRPIPLESSSRAYRELTAQLRRVPDPKDDLVPAGAAERGASSVRPRSARAG